MGVGGEAAALVGIVLADQADRCPVGQGDRSADLPDRLAEDRLDQGGLPAAVVPSQQDTLALLDRQGEVGEELASGQGDPDLLEGQQGLVVARLLVDGQWGDGLDFLEEAGLGRGDLVEPVGHRLRLLHHLGGLGPDETLISVGVVALLALGALGPLEALLLGGVETLDIGVETVISGDCRLVAALLLGEVGGIVAPFQDQLVTLNHQGVVNHPVEKGLVVAGDDEALLLGS